VLGINTDSMNLTEDGLRLVLHDGNSKATYYTDRPSLSAAFRTPIVVDTVPVAASLYPYMSEDCGRLYLSALDRNFYIVQ
jgi:hypothetical protein